MRFIKFVFILILPMLLASTCNKPEKFGNIVFTFNHTIDGVPIQWDKLIYTNAAGNKYQVNEIKYFISKMTFLDENQKPQVMLINDYEFLYIDNSISTTLHVDIEKILPGKFAYISFIFGLDKDDNVSNRFVNPPECNFSWPAHLGGGYHYMQINGKFENKEGNIQNMNIHTGIGQLYDENDKITEYVQNYFTVTLPVKFAVYENQTTSIHINMELQRWFDTPNLYNFDDFGTGIMQNQRAQELLKENGKNVFSMINDKW